MKQYIIDSEEDLAKIFAELHNSLKILSYLIFGEGEPVNCGVKSYFQISDLRFLFREGLDIFFEKPLTIVYFNEDSLDFFDEKKRKTVNIVSYENFSEYLQINLEERCLVLSHSNNILIFSDFNDFQIFLIKNSSPLYDDKVLSRQCFNEFSYSDFENHQESQIEFFKNVLIRQDLWNRAQI